jgi:hypothetical protein
MDGFRARVEGRTRDERTRDELVVELVELELVVVVVVCRRERVK